MMMTTFINMVAFGFVAGILATKGIIYTHWEFWAVIAALVVIQLNNAFGYK